MSSFEGFGPDFAQFFTELAVEQNRDWFQANKARYEAAVKTPCRDLIVAVNEALSAADIPLSGDPKRSLTRLNRDVRFSNDKSPYKTYAAATFTREPGEMSPGLLYVSLSADECFAGAGFYAVDPADLSAMRRAIANDPDAWLAVEAKLQQAGSPLELGEALKRMPKGFENFADSPVADALKLKAHVCKYRFTANDLGSDLPQRIAAFVIDARPLLHFGWKALAKRQAS